MPDDLLPSTVLASPVALTLAQLLVAHPHMARRTAQRALQAAVEAGHIAAVGEGRARRYQAPGAPTAADTSFPAGLVLSADSRDILAYVDQPLSARKPVGYQAELLAAYRPNGRGDGRGYLSVSLRRQLHKMGRTPALPTAPAGTYSRAILNRLLIDLSWASSQLEGNTYSRLDTRALIEQGRAASGKAAIETQMILNHKAAIELLVANIEHVGFDRYTLMNLHSALAENLLPNPADEGRVRQHAVEVGHSVYRPLSVSAQIDTALDALLRCLQQIDDPFEQAFAALAHLPYLQPFADVNKRSSRLMANLPLFRANLCPLTFIDVPEPAYSRAMLGVYEMGRVELLRDVFVWAYERSTQEYVALKQDLAEPDPLRLAWRDFVRQTVYAVVSQPQTDALLLVRRAVKTKHVPAAERSAVQALVVEELQRLHEGVLARYGLRPTELAAWKAGQAAL